MFLLFGRIDVQLDMAAKGFLSQAVELIKTPGGKAMVQNG
jgi:hypothetical protein